MSRSYRHTPICGITVAESNKADKTAAHRRWRKRCTQQLNSQPELDFLPDEKSFLNPWWMAKDGKSWFDRQQMKWLMRK